MNGELNPELVLRKIVRGDYIYHRQEELEALQAEVNAGCGIYSPEQNQQRVALQKEGGEHVTYCLSVIYAGQHDYGLNLTTLDSGRPAYGGGQCVGMTLQEVYDMYGEENVHYENSLSAGSVYITEWAYRNVHQVRLHGRTEYSSNRKNMEMKK